MAQAIARATQVVMESGRRSSSCNDFLPLREDSVGADPLLTSVHADESSA